MQIIYTDVCVEWFKQSIKAVDKVLRKPGNSRTEPATSRDVSKIFLVFIISKNTFLQKKLNIVEDGGTTVTFLCHVATFLDFLLRTVLQTIL